MNILAIESSCDETGAAVVTREENGFVIKSNIVASQIETHRLYGGVVPEIASRAHIEAVSKITYEAMEEAGIDISSIDAVCVTANPGLIGALLVGVNFAKALAFANGKPLVAVDHIKGHIAAAYLTKDEDAPKPPYIALAVSGGHTAIYLVRDYTDMRLIGTTLDDAIGESFDKIGRIIGIPYPAGAGFDALAREGFIKATGKETGFYEAYSDCESYRDPEWRLPSPVIKGGCDFSFSGLKTAAINLLHKFEQSGRDFDKSLFAARYTYEAVEAVARQVETALVRYPECNLCAVGGVAANSHLRERLKSLAKAHKRELFLPPLSLCADNAAMIAAQGYYEFMSGRRSDSSLNASALDSLDMLTPVEEN